MLKILLPATLALLLAACSPTFDWREIRGEGGPYTVMLPAKPSTHTRTVELGAIKVSMTMTAAQVEGNVFAVGTARLDNPAQAPAALAAMKTALVKNLAGSVVTEKPVAAGKLAGVEIDVRGTRRLHGKAVPTRMVARLYASGAQVYQVMAVGDERALNADMLDMFLPSFKPY